jgi:DNA adenine methylase
MIFATDLVRFPCLNMSVASQVLAPAPDGVEATPFLKWAGGKGQILPQIAAHFPKSFNNYFEPFLGSAAVYFHLVRERPNLRATLIDLNAELINSFQVIRASVDDLIPKLRQLQGDHGKKHYYETRSKTPTSLTSVDRAARFIYLNKTCYNGLYRVNSRGEFNVPVGSYKNPRIFDEENLKAVAVALAGTKLLAGHFSTVLPLAKRGDFIYFDPPYYTETDGFTGYAVAASGRANFSANDHTMLRNNVKRLVERGCHVVVSNSDTRFIRWLYKDYAQYGVNARRFINCNGSGRQPVRELVIVGR